LGDKGELAKLRKGAEATSLISWDSNLMGKRIEDIYEKMLKR
jgi:hypothetical protein